MESSASGGTEHSEPDGVASVGYVRVETIIAESPDAVPSERPVRWPPTPDQAAELADWMDPELLHAWEILARDLNTPDAIYPFLARSDWGQPEIQATAGVWWEDGRGSGISVPPGEPPADRVVHLADQFQESEVEALWFAGRRSGRTARGIQTPTR